MNLSAADHDIVLGTFDHAPSFAIGFVRDLRVRWALEEAGLPYRVASVPFHQRRHFARQPFGQVPFLRDGDKEIFESGAILLYLGEKSEALLPGVGQPRLQAVNWLFAALNSVEPDSSAWLSCQFQQAADEAVWRTTVTEKLHKRLAVMERELGEREWLAGRFSIADIAMSDVLRVVAHFGGLLTAYPACRAYVARATARPAFVKALQDQRAHFAPKT